MIDQPSDVGGWRNKSEVTLVDTMMVTVCRMNGKKKIIWIRTTPADGTKYSLSPEYTNLEVYMNNLVNHLFPHKEIEFLTHNYFQTDTGKRKVYSNTSAFLILRGGKTIFPMIKTIIAHR